MKISLSWLKEFVPYAGTAQELDTLLTRAGLEVASIETRGADFPKVVVAQILESVQHPNADRLSVCKVDDGSGEPRQIVCGAKNYKVGDKVPLALPGAVLPGDFRIKSGKLRGVESDGMMCSAKELSLAEDAQGLLILPPDLQAGTPISEVFPPETVLEIEITPNRPDWLSHVGVAREVAANTGLPSTAPRPVLPPTAEDAAVARIEDSAACPFYSVRRISGVKIGPSPEWLKRRIESVGLRAINNVVDVTNYVMMELGQPLHAFDAAMVNEGIVVRRAAGSEPFFALDGRRYLLRNNDLVIADRSESCPVLALAGVMGGNDSGVSETTTDILLESALFDAPAVRATARGLDLHSDSSYRFERGVDPAGVLRASARAAELIVEVAGGAAAEFIIVAGELPPRDWTVGLSYQSCRDLLGIELSNDEIDAPLAKLGLEKVSGDDEASAWKVPSFRADLTRDVDLIEEVVRLVGIENIPARLAGTPSAATQADIAYDDAMHLRKSLRSLGFSEARTSTLVSRAGHGEFHLVELKNPLGEEQSALRPTLLTGLLAAAGRNLNFGASRVQLFEIGRVFSASSEEEVGRVAFVVTGDRLAKSWRRPSSEAFDFFDLKGIVESLVPGVSFRPATRSPYALAIEVVVGDFSAGFIGQIAPAAARALNARGPVVVAELRLELLEAAYHAREFVPIPKFPSITRDLAAIVPREMAFGSIEGAIHAAKEPLLAGLQVFDVFTDDSGERLAADRKSVAFSLTFRSPERTLTADEVNAASDRLKSRLREVLGLEFRE